MDFNSLCDILQTRFTDREICKLIARDTCFLVALDRKYMLCFDVKFQVATIKAGDANISFDESPKCAYPILKHEVSKVTAMHQTISPKFVREFPIEYWQGYHKCVVDEMEVGQIQFEFSKDYKDIIETYEFHGDKVEHEYRFQPWALWY